MTKCVTVTVIGAGSRGTGYANYAKTYPEKLKVVGVAEPRDFRRKRMIEAYNIPQQNVFNDWKLAAAADKLSDCVIISTQDKLHKDPAIAFANKGYHILLEKPMATTEADCRDIVAACQANNVILSVGHVLKYLPVALKIKQLIKEKEIGELVNIQLLEPVGFWHFAHSFVRGNWSSEEESCFSLLAKSCHDIDLLFDWALPAKCTRISSFGSLIHFHPENKVGFWHFSHSYVRGNWHKEEDSCFSLMTKSCHDIDLIFDWALPAKCTKVSSFGSLLHFRPENKPSGAGSRCLDCNIEETCPYSAKKVYINAFKNGHRGWPNNVVTDVPDIESLTEALKTGPYGQCVYEGNNDVMDNQVVNLQFDGGQTASFTMVAFTEKVCTRQVRVFGTKGELSCDFDSSMIKHYDFLTRHTELIPAHVGEGGGGGHGGSDLLLMGSFVDAVALNDPSKVLDTPEDTLQSHLLTFAAEKARKEDRVIHLSPTGDVI